MSDITVLAHILRGAPAGRPRTISARTIKNADGTATLELRPEGWASAERRCLTYPSAEDALDDTIAQLGKMSRELRERELLPSG